MSTVFRNFSVIGAVIAVHMVLIYMLAFGLKQVSAPPQLITVTLQTSLLPPSANSKDVPAPAAASIDEPVPKPLVPDVVKEAVPQKPEQKPAQPKPKDLSPQPLKQEPTEKPIMASSPQAAEHAAASSQATQIGGVSSTDAAPGQTAAKSGGTPEAQGRAEGGATTAPSHSAAYLKNAQPVYPPLSRRLGEEGKVVLRTLVSAKGTALNVEIKHSSGHKRLDQAALNAVKRWRFIPARDRGTPIDMWHDVPIHFSLEDV